MKKLLATAAALLLAFGSVALSSQVATADDVPVTDQVTSESTDTQTPEGDAPPTESAPTDEVPAETAPAEESAPPAETEPVTGTSEAEPPVEEDAASGTDPPVETFSRMLTQSFDAEAYYGTIGTLQPFTPQNNSASAWSDAGPHDDAVCYKYDSDDNDFADNSHATVINDGKTVVLKPYGADWPGDHWEILVVKASTWDAVTIHPEAGTWYAAYDNKDISHYIVCKGTTPEGETPVASAEVQTTPGTCGAAGTVTGTNAVNATFGAPSYNNGTYTIVATATGDAEFAEGEGVSDDGTTKTFTGPVPARNLDLCAVASATVKTTPGTCEAAGSVSGDTVVNATFGAPSYDNGTYTIVATATGTAKFATDEGVSADRTTKTFTGPVPAQNTELCEGTVSYCHAMPADTAANGWQLMSDMPVQSVNGHLQHAADIIPPVPGILPNGLNWAGSFEVNGVELTAQEILRLGCDFDITVPYAPDASNEYCFGGETQDGSITVYFGDLGAKIQYRITGGDDVDLLVESGDATTVYLPAGDYTVTAEAVAPYELTGTTIFERTIGSAVNCVCAVDTVSKVFVLAVLDPECAEAAVSVKPATCEAASSLVLGDTLHATFGEPVIENGQYSVIATAEEGYRFAPGDGVTEDGTTKTFEGALGKQPTVCGDLPTLSLPTGLPNTGSTVPGGALWLGALALGLGTAAVIVASRKSRVNQQ